MKKHSKILCLALSLIMMLSLLPTVVFAETPTKLTKITVEIDTPYAESTPTFNAKIIDSAEVSDIANGNYYINIANWECYTVGRLAGAGTYSISKMPYGDITSDTKKFRSGFSYAMKAADAINNYATSVIPTGYFLADDTEVKIVGKNGTVYVESIPLAGRDASNTTDPSQLFETVRGAAITIITQEPDGTENTEYAYPGPGLETYISASSSISISGTTLYFSHWETDADVVFDDKYAYEAYVTAPNPARDITIRAIYEDRTTEYDITATNGTVKVNGTEKTKAYAGNLVELEANTAPTGQVFDKWEITGLDTTGMDLTKEELSFNMPASAVTATATYMNEPAPTITAGANQEWTKGTTTGFVVTSDADFANFTEVKVDGVAVDVANYDVVSGSTKVTLKPAYLETLAVGTHTLDIVSTNGTASTSFTIKAAAVTPGGTTPGGTTPGGTTTGGTTGGNSNTGNKPNPNTGVTSPQTGDNSNMFLWIALAFASFGGIATITVISRRKRAK